MTLDTAVHNVVLQIGDTGNGHSGLYPLIDCSQPPGVCAAARNASNTESPTVHLGAGLEIIEGPYAVPGLNTGRCVAAAVPPPHIILIRTVMYALDFT